MQYPNRRIFKRVRTLFWIFEILELLLSIAIIGVTGSAAQGLKNNLDYLTVPSKLGYNIAIAVITMLSLLLLIPLDLFRPTLWGHLNTIRAPWPRAVLNSIFTIFWAAAIGSSVYTCGNLCSAAGSTVALLKYANLCCDCTTSSFSDQCSAGVPWTHIEAGTGAYEVAQALDAIVMALFLVSTFMLAALYWVHEPAAQPAPDLALYGNAGGAPQMVDPDPLKYSSKDITNWEKWPYGNK